MFNCRPEKEISRTVVGKCKATVKADDKRQDYWGERIVSALSLWSKSSDSQEKRGVLVQKGRTIKLQLTQKDWLS